MSSAKPFLSGVVEGFYGRAWSHETRLAYAGYLAQAGLNTYLYCPKSDAILRRDWREPWPELERQHIKALSSAFSSRGLYWGVGLSPLNLYQSYGRLEQEQLHRKIDYLGELGAPLLAILFDDMPGDLDALAARQAEIVNDVQRWMPQVRLLVCPTYYSYDPVLERFFGDKPPQYWPQLGRELATDVEIFWTGNEVCSVAIEPQDLHGINQQLGREVVLWDNYPVNDGAQRSNFLYTQKLGGRPAELRSHVSGHLCNPMNQGLLSLPALVGLAQLYGSKSFDEGSLAKVLGEQTWSRLAQDGALFERQGLSGMGESTCRELAALYAQMDGPAALEVTQWLRGEYEFDPACLTD